MAPVSKLIVAYVLCLAFVRSETSKPNLEVSIISEQQKAAVILIRKNLASEENHRNYSIIICTESKRIHINNVTSKVWHDVYYQEEAEPYVVTPDGWNPFSGCTGGKVSSCVEKNGELSVQYTLGSDNTCEDVEDTKSPCNGPLHPHTEYYVFIRQTFNGSFIDTQPTPFKTKYNNKFGVNAILSFTVILLLIIIIFGIIMHYHSTSLKDLFSTQTSIPTISHINIITCPRKNRTPMPDLTISNRAVIRPVNIGDFQTHYQIMAADSGLKFSEEYEELKVASPVLPKIVAQLPENVSKNRWTDIHPFDQSRVILSPINGDLATDYINASYIPGVNFSREYIASQGPLPGTVNDFWRMVWEQSSQMIVMVTQLIEMGQMKCEQYWPNDRHVRVYGDLSVHMRLESVFTDFTIRMFYLSQGSRSREIKQMHFTKWPDRGCPENTGVLLNFVHAVREQIPRENSGPIIVHCSAGIGRTGTFIAVDKLLQHIQSHTFVDIYGVVLDMRSHRVGMVQTKEHYIYIHECILDFLTSNENSNDDEKLYENLPIAKSRNKQVQWPPATPV